MRIWLILTFIALMLTSCNKEIESLNNNSPDEEHTLSIRVMADKVGTKALNSNDISTSDNLKRLDLYVFHMNEPLLDEHITLEPNPSGITTYSFKEKKGERIGVLAIGNLHEDTAKLLEGKTLDQLSEDYEIEAMIVLSAGNFDIDRVVMVGAKYYNFSADGTVDIELRRLMYRIDIGKITVAPENQELIGKEVYVKNITLTNICNYFVTLNTNSIGHFNTWYSFFGNEYNMTNAFGGVERGFEFYRNAPKGWDVNGSFTMDGPGILNGTFPYMINSNYQKDPGVLNVDATGILRDVTYHGYDNDAGEGLVVSSGDISLSHSMSVGKCFYGFMETSDIKTDFPI